MTRLRLVVSNLGSDEMAAATAAARRAHAQHVLKHLLALRALEKKTSDGA